MKNSCENWCEKNLIFYWLFDILIKLTKYINLIYNKIIKIILLNILDDIIFYIIELYYYYDLYYISIKNNYLK